MYINEKIGKTTIKWNGRSLTTSRESQFLQEQVLSPVNYVSDLDTANSLLSDKPLVYNKVVAYGKDQQNKPNARLIQ